MDIFKNLEEDVMEIDWHSSKNLVLLNTRISQEDRLRIERFVNSDTILTGHIWLATSGSTSQYKLVALSKNALLTSAKAINEHFQCNKNDVWMNPLPIFHVGGLGILARGFLSQSKIVQYQEKWNVHSFNKHLCEAQGTLTALVPTQVYDLVVNQLRAPKCLRATIVGGGNLSEDLYFQGNALGWNLHPSYGLTECCSQVATAEYDHDQSEYPKLRLLNHIEAKINSHGCICLRSKALLSCYALWAQDRYQMINPKVDEWFTSEDRGELHYPYLNIFGRDQNFVKVGGESVDIGKLEKILESLKLSLKLDKEVIVVGVRDPRLGHSIHLVVARSNPSETQELVEAFNRIVLPFERIRQIHDIDSIPRSPLNKVLKEELLSKIGMEEKGKKQ